MDTAIIDCSIAVAGVICGATLSRVPRGWRRRRHPNLGSEPEDMNEMEPLIQDAAFQWADSIGRPEAASLAAGKLRTLYRIKHNRATRLR